MRLAETQRRDPNVLRGSNPLPGTQDGRIYT
jgi:hypothetical protein